MALNWAMISGDGRAPVPLPGEKMFLTQIGVRLELNYTNGYPGNAGDIFVSNNGILYLSNMRIIYICTPPQEQFKSLSVPLLNFKECKLVQPWFSANYYEGHLIPVPGGGISEPGLLKLIFKEGGGFEFNERHNDVLARLRETGETPDTYEPLPVYPGRSESSSETPIQSVESTALPTITSHTHQGRSPITEEELPPAYDDARA